MRATLPHHGWAVVGLDEASGHETSRLGGKGAGLAALRAAPAPVPRAFVVTTGAYTEAVTSNALNNLIESSLRHLNANDVAALMKSAREIRAAISEMEMAPTLIDQIRDAYKRAFCGATVPVAVRSSANAEDLPDASFAGVGDTYLWVHGVDAILERVKACWASLFNERAIAYRADHRIEFEPAMAVVVQEMVDAEAAGVAMTLDPKNGDRSKIIIESTWGLGETLVSGEITPDHFVVDKVILEPVGSMVARKDHELIGDETLRKAVRCPVEESRQAQPSLTDGQIIAIARLAKRIERHFGCPQDIEWALDRRRSDDDGIRLLQSRPETVWSRRQTPTVSPRPYATGAAGVMERLVAPLATVKTQKPDPGGRKT